MKSIFFKNFSMTAMLLAVCFLLLSVSFIGIGRTYLIEDYRRDMMASTDEVAHAASAIARTDSMSDWTLSMIISSISGATGNHVFITDPQGVIIGYHQLLRQGALLRAYRERDPRGCDGQAGDKRHL